MKISTILNVILAVAVIALVVKIAFFTPKQAVNGGSDDASAVLNNIMTRVSVRAYQDKAVEDEKIETMLRAAMAAPTAGNKQPWRFVVIKDKNTLAAISQNFRTMRMAENAPMAVVVCGDMNDTFPEEGIDYWVQDASAATENLLLAAHSMGLGAVWCGVTPLSERVNIVKEMLKLPQNIIPLNVIVVGYPAENPAPKDKWKPEYISYEIYGEGDSKAAIASEQKVAPKTLQPFDITKEMRENPFDFFRGAGLVLAAGKKGDFNEMTIGWGGLGTLWSKPVVTVYVAPARYTFNYMENSEYFTVMRFPKELNEIPNYMGSNSGRDGNKAEAMNLHTKFTENGTPYFEEADLVIECRKIYSNQFNKAGFGDVPTKRYESSTSGVHHMYVGEVVSALKK